MVKSIHQETHRPYWGCSRLFPQLQIRVREHCLRRKSDLCSKTPSSPASNSPVKQVWTVLIQNLPLVNLDKLTLYWIIGMHLESPNGHSKLWCSCPSLAVCQICRLLRLQTGGGSRMKVKATNSVRQRGGCVRERDASSLCERNGDLRVRLMWTECESPSQGCWEVSYYLDLLKGNVNS